MTSAKKIIILFGDILILYGALILTLIFRYGPADFGESFNSHLKPFSLIFFGWILIFYLIDLYKIKRLRIDLKTIQNFLLAIIISAVVSIILFYLFPTIFKLTPKTNLAIFALIFGILSFCWRIILTKIYISGGLKTRLLIVGDSPMINEIIDYLKNNPQLGYEIVTQKSRFDAVIVQHYFKKDPELIKKIYLLLPQKINIIDSITFYEEIFQKLPFSELEEIWFIEKIAGRKRLYDSLKRIADFSLSLFSIVVLLPLLILVSVLIKLTSRGKIIYKQERVGIDDKLFVLYKFRTMRTGEAGPLWTVKNDRRLTFIGKILRYAHLDEFPQLWNILKGDISFVGPRPERKELVEFYKELPYYEIRHFIKPGLTGWAQINYKPSASIKEAEEKLCYDIYYIKNRSLILDLLILLRTIRYLFVSNK